MRVLPLLLLGFVICAKADWYLKYNFMDAPNKDLSNANTTDIATLEKDCSANTACKGFNSNGWLKSDVSAPVASTADLYVRFTGTAPNQPNIWPYPQNATWGSINLTIDPNTFQFVGKPDFADLDYAFNWFREVIFPHPINPSRQSQIPLVALPSLVVAVTDPTAPLQLGVNEGYTLIIPSDGTGATITAQTFYGALNGLQTFSQLVTYKFNQHAYTVNNAPWNVQDKPRYSHRGLLIDTSRHFEPIQVLKQLVDSLSFAKLNVLHWHIVDDQSFPFESISYPNLWNGAYSDVEKYSQEDVVELVEYARLRNVRVMVEFDTPGHATSWCVGYMNVCPSTTCRSPLNPAVEDTFTLITNLFNELTGNKTGSGLFPENFLHLGGDEVDTSCWTKTPSIQNWMTANNYTADQAYFYFVNRTFQISLAQGRDPVNWEEVYTHFTTELNKKAIVHAWKNKTTVSAAVKNGYRALNSQGWYLDHLNDLWETYYNNDPMAGITDVNQQQLVLGGEACMWGETVDPSDIFNTIWPRASAAAERLWSASTITNTDYATPRYEWFRCLLTQRGINAAPSNNAAARSAPPGPGGCLFQ